LDIRSLPDNGFIQKLSFDIYRDFKGIGNSKLVDSLHELVITNVDYQLYIQQREMIDSFIYGLSTHTNLKKLSIPYEYRFIKQFVVPHGLDDLEYTSVVDSLSKIVVPKNKVFKSCFLKATSIQDLQWVYDKTWISKLQIKSSEPITIPKQLLQNYIKLLVVDTNVTLEDDMFPESLEYLGLNAYRINKGMLPSGLKELVHFRFSQPIEHGLFPNSLNTIKLSGNIQQFEPGCLPPNLKTMQLWYDYEIQQDTFPQSLETLFLITYNQPLKPNVLPKGLKKLICRDFKNELHQHSLPLSLTHLDLTSFSGSFSSVGALDKLNILKIKSLNPSVLTLLQNVKDVYIEFRDNPDNTTLYNTGIERLHISAISSEIPSQPFIAPINFFPLSLRYLVIQGVSILSTGIINDGCLFVTSISNIIDDAYIPSSVIEKTFK